MLIIGLNHRFKSNMNLGKNDSQMIVVNTSVQINQRKTNRRTN
jgi:hypothetical protein